MFVKRQDTSHISTALSGRRAMLVHMEDELTEALLELMVEEAEATFSEVYKIYLEFYSDMYQFIKSSENEVQTPPPAIRPYLTGLTWTPISQSWYDTKLAYVKDKSKPLGFYHGLTKFRRKAGGQPFKDFIAGIGGNKSVLSKTLGEPLMQYDVSKGRKKFSVTSNGRDISYIRTDLVKDGQFQSKSQKDYEIKATIYPFPKLLPASSGPWNEWRFVNRMMREVGRGSPFGKQLVKINGRTGYGSSEGGDTKARPNGGERPIRPLVIPTVLRQLERIRKKIGA